jgi:hypothetical protein
MKSALASSAALRKPLAASWDSMASTMRRRLSGLTLTVEPEGAISGSSLIHAKDWYREKSLRES